MRHLSVLSCGFPITNGCARDRADSFHTHIEEIKRTVLPVEFAGTAGDVLFFHHRVLHTGKTTGASACSITAMVACFLCAGTIMATATTVDGVDVQLIEQAG